MFDLKLNTFKDEFDFNQDPVEVFSDFIIAQEELYQAEQELFEINRAYENLTAIQEVVAKHGWNEVLNDLVGDQVSAESLDFSCEGALDKIKGAVKKVGKAVGDWVTRFTNVLNLYIKRFNAAKEWLSKHINETAHSTVSSRYAATIRHATEVLGYEGKIYDIQDLITAHTNRSKHVKDESNENEIFEYINHVVKTVDYSKLSNKELIPVIDVAIRELPKAVKSINNASSNYRGLKVIELGERERAKNAEKKKNEAKDIRSAVDAEDVQKTNETLANVTHRMRQSNVLGKIYFHLIVMSCKALDAELKKRGFRSEF